jgi:hypothetical protein
MEVGDMKVEGTRFYIEARARDEGGRRGRDGNIA